MDSPIPSKAPGIYSLPAAEYHAMDCISKSGLDAISHSPAHFRYGRQEETPAMRLGTAVHAAVLESGRFHEAYVRANGRRNKAAEKAELTALEWETCEGIAEAIRAHPTCQKLLSEGMAEQAVFWYDSGTMLLCRCRPDWARSGMLLDLKTTTDASPAGFARAIERYRYHVQAAFYMDGWNAVASAEDHVGDFIFIAAEKNPPYAVGLYRLPDWKIEEGRSLYRRDLAVYEDCLLRDEWPGYSKSVETLIFTG